MEEQREDQGLDAAEGTTPEPPEPPTPPGTPPQADKRQSGCYTACLVVLVLVVLGFLFIMLSPLAGRPHDRREAEVKSNLHNIQLSVERFAVDTEGAYPNYLIGGEPKYAAAVDPGSRHSAFTDIRECEPIEGVSDPLLRKGYIDSYPRNPFVRDGTDIHLMQEDLPSSEIYGCDPLRNGTPEAEVLGTRFGAYCSAMGSVLADPRWRGLRPYSLPDGTTEDWPAYADVEYEFWDMWAGSKPEPFLPGQFFYKGVGPLIAVIPDAENGEAILPTEIDMYILGAYGHPRTKGKDVLGTEQTLTYLLRADPDDPESEETEVTAWRMTRSEVSDDPTKREGSPYSMGPNARGENVVAYGNPNGIRDGIILVLTGGADYIGD